MVRTTFYFVIMEKKMKDNKVTLVQLQFGRATRNSRKLRNNFFIKFGLWLLREHCKDTIKR